MVRIRPATTADAVSIVGMIYELAECQHLRHFATVTEHRLRSTLFSGNGAAEALIAEWCESAAGFSIFFPTYSTFSGERGLHLEDLYVKPQLRGKGIGTALLGYVAHIAELRNYDRIECEVLDWNKDAIRFYQRVGAVRYEQWGKYRLDRSAVTKLASHSSNSLSRTLT